MLFSSIPEYIFQLLDPKEDSLDILAGIFENKYSECLEVYWLIKEYSENITNLEYDYKQDKKVKSLNIHLKLKDVPIEKVIEEMEAVQHKYASLKVKEQNGMLHISLRTKKPKK